jgi:hypothetical protein
MIFRNRRIYIDVSEDYRSHLSSWILDLVSLDKYLKLSEYKHTFKENFLKFIPSPQ